MEVLTTDLLRFEELKKKNTELKAVLKSPAIPRSHRLAIVSDVIEKLQLGGDARKVLLVVAEAGRLSELETILEQVRLFRLRTSNRMALRVETATPLASDEARLFEKRFSVMVGADVEASFEVNPDLVGGFRAEIAGKIYDGSVEGWLGNFEEKSAGGM
jgi:ATP synthase F1 delta subunit